MSEHEHHHHDHEHEHHHDHEHEHHHHHHDGEECSDPNCGCHDHHHHHHGEEVIENALIYSRAGRFSSENPLTLGEAADKVRGVLLAIADVLAVEGMVLGHVKALLHADNASCTLSSTHVGECTLTYTAEGSPESRASEWELTVNVISAVKPENDPIGLLDPLFAD